MQNMAGLGQDFSFCEQLFHESHYVHIFGIDCSVITVCNCNFISIYLSIYRYIYTLKIALNYFWHQARNQNI